MYDTLRPELLTATEAQRKAMERDPVTVVQWDLFRVRAPPSRPASNARPRLSGWKHTTLCTPPELARPACGPPGQPAALPGGAAALHARRPRRRRLRRRAGLPPDARTLLHARCARPSDPRRPYRSPHPSRHCDSDPPNAKVSLNVCFSPAATRWAAPPRVHAEHRRARLQDRDARRQNNPGAPLADCGGFGGSSSSSCCCCCSCSSSRRRSSSSSGILPCTQTETGRAPARTPTSYCVASLSLRLVPTNECCRGQVHGSLGRVECEGCGAPYDSAAFCAAVRCAPGAKRLRRRGRARPRRRGDWGLCRRNPRSSKRRWTPPPPPRTKWTRRVPHLVLIGHAASLTPY